MSSANLTPVSTRQPLPHVAARVLLVLLGAIVVGGSIYFTFFAGEEAGGVSGAIDWALAAWALLNGIGFVAAAFILGRRETDGVRIARLLIIAHLIFSAIKIVGYSETEAIGLVVVDILILALLQVGSRSATSPRSHAHSG